MLRRNCLLVPQHLPVVMGPRFRGDDTGAGREKFVGWVERGAKPIIREARSVVMGFAFALPILPSGDRPKTPTR